MPCPVLHHSAFLRVSEWYQEAMDQAQVPSPQAASAGALGLWARGGFFLGGGDAAGAAVAVVFATFPVSDTRSSAERSTLSA